MTKLLGPTSRQAVLGAFFNQARYEGHVREVARRTGISPASASHSLAELEGEGVLISRMAGRNRLYRLADTAVARSVRDLYAKAAAFESLRDDQLHRSTDRLQRSEGVAQEGGDQAGGGSVAVAPSVGFGRV